MKKQILLPLKKQQNYSELSYEQDHIFSVKALFWSKGCDWIHMLEILLYWKTKNHTMIWSYYWKWWRFQYIPVLKNLSTIMKDEDEISVVLYNQASFSGRSQYRNFLDEQVYSQNLLFNSQRMTLQLCCAMMVLI